MGWPFSPYSDESACTKRELSCYVDVVIIEGKVLPIAINIHVLGFFYYFWFGFFILKTF